MLTPSHGRPQRGSVLMLVPAAVLVLFVLGATAVDHAIAFLGQRELTGAAAAAANDAATAALSDERFYDGEDEAGVVAIDQGKAEEVVRRALELRQTRGVVLVAPPAVSLSESGRQVCVTLVGRVEYVFAKAVPGASRGTVVRGRAVATAVEGGAGAAVPSQTVTC